MAYIDIQNVTYTYPLTKTPSIADVNLSFERKILCDIRCKW